MNSCVLMAEIIKEPQRRYTPDNQTAIAEMLVEFPALRAEDPPATIKVVGWGDLADEIKENYHQGDRVVLQGRLSMNTIERQEGFKEKRAEFTVSKIYSLEAAAAGASRPIVAAVPPPQTSNVVSINRSNPVRSDRDTMNDGGTVTEYQTSSFSSERDSNTFSEAKQYGENSLDSDIVESEEEDEIPF